jgi:hypothetical protein
MFAKSSRGDIEEKELRWFKTTSKEYLEYTEDKLEARIKEG